MPYATPSVPLDNVGAVVMVGPAMIVIDISSVAVPFALSVTCTVKPETPRAAAVGVPLKTPPVLSERPARSDPAVIDHLKPEFEPPVAISVCE